MITWSSKKQNIIALSTTEAEYISIANCYAQILWIKHQLEDFNLRYIEIPILCDNTSTINFTKNPLRHSRSKHIDIKHYFIRDNVQKEDIELNFINTEDQIANIFIKPLAKDHFCYIKNLLNMVSF